MKTRYKIAWIGTVAINILTPRGRSINFSLPSNESVPVEFKEGDEVTVENHPDALPAMEFNDGYYEITHIESGKVLRTLHNDDKWRLEIENS